MDPDPESQKIGDPMDPDPESQKIGDPMDEGKRKKIGFNGSRSLGFIYLNCVLAPPSSSRFAIILKLEIYNK